MQPARPFVDIHCHLMPGIDDGAKSWDDTVAMAELAARDGTGTIILTPHQLGNFCHNLGDDIRSRTQQVQEVLDTERIPLRVLPGGDVRIEDDMMQMIQTGEVLTLADQGVHVLLELPHELYFPLEPVLRDLTSAGMQGILSHPERNAGLLSQPQLLPQLVEQGCLMQVTSGSLAGSFGPASQRLAENMLRDGLVHFLASDGHGPRSRRPLMGRGFRRASELVGEMVAEQICCTNPASVVEGKWIEPGRLAGSRKKKGWFRRLTA